MGSKKRFFGRGGNRKKRADRAGVYILRIRAGDETMGGVSFRRNLSIGLENWEKCAILKL